MADITYNIYRDGEVIANGIEGNSYTDTGLEPNKTYSYQISAVNKYGESELSDPVMATTDYSAVATVTLNKNEAVINLGETETLTATVSPDTADQGVQWSSNNEDVATVNDGTVTAVGEGEAIITASSTADPEKTDTCTVNVVDEGEPPGEVEGLQVSGKTDTTVDLEWNE